MQRLRIALIIPGGIGTGDKNVGIPVLEQIVNRLSGDFDISVFQLFPTNQGYSATNFELISIYSRNSFVKTLKFFIAFRRAHRKKKFNVIHGFWALPGGLFAVIAGKIFKLNSIVSLLGGDTVSLPKIQYGQLRNPIYKKLILWTVQEVNKVIALTQYLVNNIKEAGSKRKDFEIIPWGIDTELFSFTDHAINNPVQFLHVANLHPVKDQTTLLKAFKLISDRVHARLTIIGVGIDEQKVKELIAKLELASKVTWIDIQRNEDLPKYYHQSDILLHTSLSEGQSEVVTEAMSCGVLVCGTRVGLLYDLPNCCVAVDRGDYNNLANEVLTLLNDQPKRDQIKEDGRQWSESHSIIWTVKQIGLLYERLGTNKN